MSVARFIADQRTMHRVPHAVTCAILGVSVSWFYKWVHRKPTPTDESAAISPNWPRSATGSPSNPPPDGTYPTAHRHKLIRLRFAAPDADACPLTESFSGQE